MSFSTPEALWLLLLAPAAAALYAYASRKRAEALAAFLGSAAPAAVSRETARRRVMGAALVVGAVACLAVALAGPRFGRTLRETAQESLDLVVALDVSESMWAEDVAPSRLDRAKLEIQRIVEQRPGARVGLVVFAGEAFLQCPLTTDRSAFRLFLDAAEPELVPLQGTDLGAALRVAGVALEEAADVERPRAVLIVSDGEAHEGSAEAEADALRDGGATVLAIGVGTDEGGPIPLKRRGRLVGYKTARGGDQVTTRYEGAALREVAGRGGVYRLDRRGSIADEVARQLDALDQAVVGGERYEAYAERFQWPLGLALLLLLAERALWLVPEARRRALADA
ncbi:MAG TPA: VWA domain-containing protein [Bacteroidetes bacterium]|nr:VWA domain-containing protein [Bacteroidota bacterium]